MAFTGRLGTDESQPGNIQPGADGSWSDDSAYQADAFQNDAFQTVALDPLDQIVFDTVAMSVAVVRALTTSRSSTDASTTSDAVVRGINRPGVATDAVTTSDSAASAGAFTRTATEGVTTHEGTGHDTFQSDAFQSHTFQVGFATRLFVGAREVAEAPTTAEDADSLRVRVRLAADDPTVSETIERTGTFARDSTDAAATMDVAVFVVPADVIEGLFGLDAFTVGGIGQHSRLTDHFGSQPDTVVVHVDGFGPYPPATTVAAILADLFATAEGTAALPNARFGLDGYIIKPWLDLEAVILKIVEVGIGLDARISRGTTFGLNAVLEGAVTLHLFGFDAYVINPSQPWNVVMSPLGGEASYTAISSQMTPQTTPDKAANGALNFVSFGDAWEKQNPPGSTAGDWWQVTWTVAQTIDRVKIYNSQYSFGPTGYLEFSDGSQVAYTGLTAGTGTTSFIKTIDFTAKTTSSLRIVSNGGGGSRVALAEVEAFDTEQWG